MSYRNWWEDVELDCGCLVSIDAYSDYTYGEDGASETMEPEGGRVTKPCDQHNPEFLIVNSGSSCAKP